MTRPAPLRPRAARDRSRALGWALPPTVALAALAFAASAEPREPRVPFPQDHTELRHVKSMVIQEGHPLVDAFGGIHHVYADEAGWEGLRDGSFENGALLVFDLFEARATDGALVEGPRKVLAVMAYDAERFSDTGGWGFEAFAGGDPEQPVVEDPVKECFACHTSQADHGYVFTRPRMQDADR